MSGVTFLTTTKDRPLAFVLCQRWVKHQTLQPTQWIIVDDGKQPIADLISMDKALYLRREPKVDESPNTLFLNLKTALPIVKEDKILFIEDDDYYAPKYAETIVAKLEEHEVVGINNSRYYYLPTCGNCRALNKRHASLAQTAFRKSFLSEFAKLLDTNTGALDLKLWRELANGRGYLFSDDNEPLCVGIKGMPGRKSASGAHTASSWRYQLYVRDLLQMLLCQWIPRRKDFNLYDDIIKGKLTEDNYKTYLMERNK